MNTSNTKPVDTIRDGSLKAVIWANFGENGTFYSVQITRTYQDEQGNYHDSDSFSNAQLLRVARLAHIAYDEILINHQKDNAQMQSDAS